MAVTLTTVIKDQTESLSRMSFRRKSTRIQTNRDQFDSIKGIGLAIVNVLLKNEESSPNFPKSSVLLASNNLKIKIPHLPLFSDPSPTDFGIKTRRKLVSPAPEWKNAVVSECLSKSEMELSEDYTRVISYGPNPRTTHIFDDCVVESCCGIVRFPAAAAAARREKNEVAGKGLTMINVKDKFLSFSCYHCRKNLQQGKDVYMYRGEKGFCSHECRQREIMLEEQEEDGEEEAMDINNNKDLKLFYF